MILVGEMRDPETMAVALHAAETGHLVLSTLHTLNATETVEPHHRHVPAPPGAADPRSAGGGHRGRGLPAPRAEGRRRGAGAGGRGPGRHRADPRLYPGPKRTTEIPAYIAQGATQYGMQTFDQCLLRLYPEGIISYETARESATNADDFDLKVRGIFSTGELTFEGEQKRTPVADKTPAGSPFARRPS